MRQASQIRMARRSPRKSTSGLHPPAGGARPTSSSMGRSLLSAAAASIRVPPTLKCSRESSSRASAYPRTGRPAGALTDQLMTYEDGARATPVDGTPSGRNSPMLNINNGERGRPTWE